MASWGARRYRETHARRGCKPVTPPRVTQAKLRGILRAGSLSEAPSRMEAPARARRGRFALVYAAVALYISVGFLDISALPAYLKYVARRDNPHATDDEIAADVAAQLAACSLTSGLLAVGIAGWAGRLSDTFGRRRCAAVPALGQATGMALLAVATRALPPISPGCAPDLGRSFRDARPISPLSADLAQGLASVGRTSSVHGR